MFFSNLNTLSSKINKLFNKNEVNFNKFAEFYNSKSNELKELDNLNLKLSKLTKTISEKDKKIEELENKIFNFQRRINCNPILPYINFEKKVFNKTIEEHKCICHICGEYQSDSVNETKISEHPEALNLNVKVSLTKNERETEIYNLNQVVKDLHSQLEIQKIQNELTEEKIINSNAFKLLMTHSEELLNYANSLKEENISLQKNNFDVIHESELKLKCCEQICDSKVSELEKYYYETKSLLEKTKIELSQANLRITSLENELKMKNIDNLVSTLNNFEEERENFLKNINTLKIKSIELDKKYQKEIQTNLLLEEKVLNATFGNNANVESFLQRRNELIKELENEIKLEKEFKENLLVELELNEKGINDLNKKIKFLTNKNLETNDKIAKLVCENLKDVEKIKKLNEEKDFLNSSIKIIEEKQKLENEKILKELEENKINKEMIMKLKNHIIIKEDETTSLNNEIAKLKQIIYTGDEIKLNMDKIIKDLDDRFSKQSTILDSLKIKYEEICKFKGVDGTKINITYNQLEKELNEGRIELNYYKVKIY